MSVVSTTDSHRSTAAGGTPTAEERAWRTTYALLVTSLALMIAGLVAVAVQLG